MFEFVCREVLTLLKCEMFVPMVVDLSDTFAETRLGMKLDYQETSIGAVYLVTCCGPRAGRQRQRHRGWETFWRVDFGDTKQRKPRNQHAFHDTLCQLLSAVPDQTSFANQTIT